MSSGIKWAGAGYVILNILRVSNIISLLLVVIASWIILVITVEIHQFFFFDGVSHIISSIISLFLISSELSLFKSYFLQHWPLLSLESGLVFLGLVMITLGFGILGNLNKGATSVDNLGLPLWRIVISSGILTALLGLFNIIATYIFCHADQGITGRQIRSYGAAVRPKSDMFSNLNPSSGSADRPASLHQPPIYNASRETSSFFHLPIVSRYSRSSSPKKSDISAPTLHDPEKGGYSSERTSPINPEVQRPPTALHPAYNLDVPAYQAHNLEMPNFAAHSFEVASYTASSRYSQVSDTTKF